jgi:acyl carrier protein
LQQQVSSAVSSILGHTVGADEPLVAAGLDSLGSVELRNSLQSSLRVELPATLVSGVRICLRTFAKLTQLCTGATHQARASIAVCLRTFSSCAHSQFLHASWPCGF